MDDERKARAYAQADFSMSNQWFVGHLVADFARELQQTVDLGCGPADVLIRLATAKADIRITGVDGSAVMIGPAKAAIEAAGLEHNISLIKGRIPGTAPGCHIYSRGTLQGFPSPSS